jgi:hypothetical protein
MRLLPPLIGLAMLAAPSLAESSAFNLTLNQPDYAPTEELRLSIDGQAGSWSCLLFDTDCTPTEILPGLIMDIGLSVNFFEFEVVMPPSETVEITFEYGCDFAALMQAIGGHYCAQAVSVDPATLQLCVSNVVDIDMSNTYGFCAPCDDCQGGVDALTMRYIGPGSGYVEVLKGGKKPATHFAANLEPGEVFSFLPAGGKDDFGKEIELYVDGTLSAKAHTSCSKPIGPGAVFGDFRVLAASSQDGGPICPVATPGPATDCSAGKPLKLEFQYTGGDCSASSHDQSADKASCSGDPTGLGTVHIIASGKKGAVYFCDTVDLGGTFWIDPTQLGESKIDNSLIIEIFDVSDNLLQTVTLHTSCSQPLAVGNIFGGVELVTFVPKP